jgi:hypothetical protein
MFPHFEDDNGSSAVGDGRQTKSDLLPGHFFGSWLLNPARSPSSTVEQGNVRQNGSLCSSRHKTARNISRLAGIMCQFMPCHGSLRRSTRFVLPTPGVVSVQRIVPACKRVVDLTRNPGNCRRHRIHTQEATSAVKSWLQLVPSRPL